jgi:hypothetical protein
LVLTLGLFSGATAGVARSVAIGFPVRIFAAEAGGFIVRVEHDDKHKLICSLLVYNQKSKGYDLQSTFPILEKFLPTHGAVANAGKRIFMAWEYVRDPDEPILAIYSFEGVIIKEFRMRDVLTPEQAAKFDDNKNGADVDWMQFIHLDKNGVLTVETTVSEKDSGITRLVEFKGDGSINVPSSK